MPRPLNLEIEPHPLAAYDGPLKDGDWVHTIDPIVICWSGPKEYYCPYRDAWITVTSNCHRVEGRLRLDPNRSYPEIETTLVHPQPKYDWQSRRRAGKPVIATIYSRGPHKGMANVAPGPLPVRNPRKVRL